MTPDGSTLQELAGRAPDAEVAARADVTLEQVRAYRRFHRIAPFVRVPPSSVGWAATPAVEEEELPPEPEAPPQQEMARRGVASPIGRGAASPMGRGSVQVEVTAPAPRPAVPPPAPPRPKRSIPNGSSPRASLAFSVAASRGDDRSTFVVVGGDIGAVAKRAQAALEARVDGPWIIEELSLLGDAIEF